MKKALIIGGLGATFVLYASEAARTKATGYLSSLDPAQIAGAVMVGIVALFGILLARAKTVTARLVGWALCIGLVGSLLGQSPVGLINQFFAAATVYLRHG